MRGVGQVYCYRLTSIRLFSPSLFWSLSTKRRCLRRYSSAGVWGRTRWCDMTAEILDKTINNSFFFFLTCLFCFFLVLKFTSQHWLVLGFPSNARIVQGLRPLIQPRAAPQLNPALKKRNQSCLCVQHTMSIVATSRSTNENRVCHWSVVISLLLIHIKMSHGTGATSRHMQRFPYTAVAVGSICSSCTIVS